MIFLLTIFLLFSTNVHASLIVTPTSWQNGDTVTAAKLNGNQNAVTNVVNGDLDNTNPASGYKFFQIVSTLPSAGDQGRVDFLTSDSSLNLDNGAVWLKTITPTGTLAIGQIPLYNASWGLLSPGTNKYPLISNGISSLPSYQQIDLTAGITNTLPIANGGTGQTTANTALNAFLPSQSGNSGKFLTTDATNSSWGIPALPTSNVLFQYSASVDSQGTNGNGEITTTTLTGATTTNYRYFGHRGVTPTTVYSTKWKKISGVSTVTIYAQEWESGANAATLKINIGTANSTNTDAGNVNTPTWVNFTIDVSGLNNGTVYDVTAQINNVNAGDNVYLGNLISFGS